MTDTNKCSQKPIKYGKEELRKEFQGFHSEIHKKNIFLTFRGCVLLSYLD